jgi:uncharacterized membrane protein
MRRHRRHFPFYVATSAALAGLVLGIAISAPAAPVLAANLFFICYLVFAIRALARLEPRHVMEAAGDDDLPVALIFLVTLAAAGASLAALFILVNGDASPSAANLIITLAAVPLGWLTVHIMAAMHYAHLYWKGRKGIAFPETKEPSGIDFIYFSLTIGMTAQTSDVAVTASDMRRLVVIHGVVSFFFNTVILAAVVNSAVSIGK